MLILVVTALSILLIPLLGGRLSHLSQLALRRSWLVALALGTQVLIISIFPGWPRPLLVTAHVLSYVLAGVFVWVNRRLPGLVVIAVGGGLNALAIAANGGQMPASVAAVRAAGLPLENDEFVNSGVLADPRLAFLGDVFASPSWLPLRNVYSIGDLVILAGACWAVHRTCRSALARDPRPWLLARIPEQRQPPGSPEAEPAAVAVPDEAHRTVAELVRERDDALAEARRTGARNVELRREITRLNQELRAAAPVPSQAAHLTGV